MIRSEWAQAHYDSMKDDPEYLTSKLMIEINDQLYARMEELHLSQRDLAKRINRSQPFVSKLLNYGNNMTLKTLVMLTQALELTIEPPRMIPKENLDNFCQDDIRNRVTSIKLSCINHFSDPMKEDFERISSSWPGELNHDPISDAA